MAKVGFPEFISACNCGKIKVRDLPEDDVYYTQYSPYVDNAPKNLPKEACPDCGGDASILMGNFHSRAYLQPTQGMTA